MNSTSRCSLFNDYLQDISNTFYVKETLKGRKYELLVFVIHISYTLCFERKLCINSLVNIV